MVWAQGNGGLGKQGCGAVRGGGTGSRGTGGVLGDPVRCGSSSGCAVAEGGYARTSDASGAGI